jgi:hypothetical protein
MDLARQWSGSKNLGKKIPGVDFAMLPFQSAVASSEDSSRKPKFLMNLPSGKRNQSIILSFDKEN